MTEQPIIKFSGYMGTSRSEKIGVELPVPLDGVEAMRQYKSFVDGLKSQGFSFTEPGLEDGQNRELITIVMRRAKPSDDTPIIDMFPNWGFGEPEPYGTHKFVRVYLNAPRNENEPDMVAEFLAASGFKSLEEIPLYESATALKRNIDKRHPKETDVPTPFYLVRYKPGKDTVKPDGTIISASWELLRYESARADGSPVATPPAQSSGNPPPATGATERKWDEAAVDELSNKYGTEVVKTVLKIRRGGDWKQGYGKAVALLEANKQATAF